MSAVEGLRIVSSKDVTAMHFDPVDPLAREQAQALLQEVFRNKVDGLVACAVRLKDIESTDSKLFYSRADLKKAYDDIDEHSRSVLVRTADRIRRFAQSQRDSIQEMTTDIPGGKAGHFIAPVKVAGCYAPGGRYPLPSSVLMTALTARTAGVQTVWVASPRPAPATLAAAYVAEVDGLLAAGGAHAIGAFAYGAGPIPSCDVIVGPGNKWVTGQHRSLLRVMIMNGNELIALHMMMYSCEELGVWCLCDRHASWSVRGADHRGPHRYTGRDRGGSSGTS